MFSTRRGSKKLKGTIQSVNGGIRSLFSWSPSVSQTYIDIRLQKGIVRAYELNKIVLGPEKDEPQSQITRTNKWHHEQCHNNTDNRHGIAVRLNNRSRSLF